MFFAAVAGEQRGLAAGAAGAVVAGHGVAGGRGPREHGADAGGVAGAGRRLRAGGAAAAAVAGRAAAAAPAARPQRAQHPRRQHVVEIHSPAGH